MTLYVNHDRKENAVYVMARAEGNGKLGDMFHVITSGETLFGKPFEFWSSLREGAHSLESLGITSL